MFGVAMPQARRRLLSGAGFVILALVGEWLGHAGTWWLSGGVGPGRALSGPMHLYLGPVGAVLAALAVAVSWLAWCGLRQLSRLNTSLHRALRGTWSPDPELRDHARSIATRGQPSPVSPLRLWAALVSVQVALFVGQENLELHALGLPLAGLHVLTAHHGLPLLAHGAVAFVGAVVAVSVLDRWATRLDEVRRVARLYVGLTPPATPVPVRPGRLDAAVAPTALFGSSFLPRPPPSWMVS